MRFIAERAPLLAAVRAASQPIKRSYIPILEHVCLIAKDNRVRVIGSDMDTEVQALCAAAVAAPGVANVHADALRAALERSGADTAEIVLSDAMQYSCGGVSVALPALDVEFPRLPKPDASEEIEGAEAALRFCAPFANTGGYADWSRGVNFEGGWAMAYSSVAFAWHEAGAGEARVIPQAAIPTCIKSLGRLFLGERTWRSEIEGVVSCGKLLDLHFPEFWRQIIRPGEIVASFDADEVGAAISAAMIGGASRTVLSLDGPRLSVSGEAFGKGSVSSAVATAACDASEPVVAVLNGAALAGILSAFQGCVVNLSVTPQGFQITPNGGPGRGAAIAPLRDARNVIPSAKVAA